MQKKSSSSKLSPEAAKILEQYRNAGKSPGEGGTAGPEGDEHTGGGAKPTTPPPSSRIQRSGNRGK